MTSNLHSDVQYVTIPDLVDRWDMSPTQIHRLIEDNYLASVRIKNVERIPADFAQADGPLQHLRGTLLSLLDAGFSNDEAITWLFAENDELDETPIRALLSGRRSAVRRAIQGLAF